MESNEYQKLTARTECDYPTVMERLRKNPELLYRLEACFSLAKTFGHQMDLLKKAFFYGKIVDETEVLEEQLTLSVIQRSMKDLQADDHFLMAFLHAPVGMCTESVELFEMVCASILDGEPFDRTNAIEEFGDALWYQGIGHNRLQAKISDTMQINIDKLNRRYPEKFTLEQSENRDVAAERELLEAAVSSETKQEAFSATSLLTWVEQERLKWQ